MARKSSRPRAEASEEAPAGGEQRAEPDAPTEGEVVAIAQVIARRRATVVGEIASARVVVKSGAPWLEAEVSDGTGTLVVTWTGRREIAGVRPGQRILVTGRGALVKGDARLVVYNPLYELL